MWKAAIGFVIGILIGCLVNPLYAGKKRDNRIADDSDMDGVVEFAIPLYKPMSFYHECCGCGLTHLVSVHVIKGPIGFPWIYMRWSVDNPKTHIARVHKFGPDYWKPDPRFSAENAWPE